MSYSARHVEIIALRQCPIFCELLPRISIGGGSCDSLLGRNSNIEPSPVNAKTITGLLQNRLRIRSHTQGLHIANPLMPPHDRVLAGICGHLRSRIEV